MRLCKTLAEEIGKAIQHSHRNLTGPLPSMGPAILATHIAGYASPSFGDGPEPRAARFKVPETYPNTALSAP